MTFRQTPPIVFLFVSAVFIVFCHGWNPRNEACTPVGTITYEAYYLFFISSKALNVHCSKSVRWNLNSEWTVLFFSCGMLTSQSWPQGGGLGWQWGPFPDSPRCCCCRNTLGDRIRTPNCTVERRHCHCCLKQNRREELDLQDLHLDQTGFSPVSRCTWAGKVALSQLCEVETPESGRGTALSVEPQCRPLPQPRRQPGQVTITTQRVGVESTGKGRQEDEFKQPHTQILQIMGVSQSIMMFLPPPASRGNQPASSLSSWRYSFVVGKASDIKPIPN